MEPRELVELLERIFRDDEGQVRYHYLLADLLCIVRGGELMAGADAREDHWVGRGDLHKFGLAAMTLKVILKGVNVR